LLKEGMERHEVVGVSAVDETVAFKKLNVRRKKIIRDPAEVL